MTPYFFNHTMGLDEFIQLNYYNLPVEMQLCIQNDMTVHDPRVITELEDRVDQLERFNEELEDLAEDWKLKCYTEEEKCEKLTTELWDLQQWVREQQSEFTTVIMQMGKSDD